MRPGSVVLDMAVEFGGNCEISENGKTIKKYDVTIIGEPNLPSLVATNSSEVYSKNLMALLDHIVKENELKLDLEEEIVKGSLITYNKEVIQERTKGLL
jgi:NAD(P) transhydrogenase subunit alpha